jgi:hypothetical protein
LFGIERSADGRNFTGIHNITVDRQRCTQPFTYIDNTDLTGNIYYRLKSTDVDGSYTYSSIIKLNGQLNATRLAGIASNPVTNGELRLNITSVKKDNVQLLVISTEGRVVQQRRLQLLPGNSVVNVDVEQLAKGTYIVKGIFNDGQSNAVLFIKQ